MIQHSIWTELYRPQTLEDFALKDEIKTKFEAYIQKQDIPHLIFSGQPGSGKTTLAKILTKVIDCDHLYINSSDENGIDVIRDRVKAFASTASFKQLKIIVLDESDYLSINGQAALRNIIETFSLKTRFILTANYLERIIEPIQSRCTRFSLEPPSKIDVAKYVVKILDSENIKYTPQNVVEVINKKYPDIRSIVNSIQENSISGELIVPKIMSIGYQKEIITKLSKPTKDTLKEIRQIIVDSDVREYEELYKLIYETFFGNPEILIILGEAQYKHTLVGDKEINFIVCIQKIIEVTKNSKQLLNG